MSVFYCDWCDQLIDSDEAPNFILHDAHNEYEVMWQCENCAERDYEKGYER
jgi:hypothetical protein